MREGAGFGVCFDGQDGSFVCVFSSLCTKHYDVSSVRPTAADTSTQYRTRYALCSRFQVRLRGIRCQHRFLPVPIQYQYPHLMSVIDTIAVRSAAGIHTDTNAANISTYMPPLLPQPIPILGNTAVANLVFFFFFFILRRMGKNKALAHHTNTSV